MIPLDHLGRTRLYSNRMLIFVIVMLCLVVYGLSKAMSANTTKTEALSAQLAKVASATGTPSQAQLEDDAEKRADFFDMDLTGAVEDACQFGFDEPADPRDKYGHQSTSVDFSSMRLTGSHSNEDGSQETVYFLHRDDTTGKWSMKEELSSGEYVGDEPTSLTAVQRVEHDWTFKGRERTPQEEEHYQQALGLAVAWHEVKDEGLAQRLTAGYRKCVLFFQSHRGIYPGMPKYKYVQGLLDTTKAWQPPDLTKVDPQMLVTIEDPERDGSCPDCGMLGPHKRQVRGRVVDLTCTRCSNAWTELAI